MCAGFRGCLSFSLLFSFFSIHLLQAQEYPENYLKAANEIIFIKPDSSRLFAEKALALAQGKENDTLAARAYFIIGTTEGMQGHYSKAQEHLVKSLTIFEKYNLIKRQASTIANIANIINAQERYGEAIEYLKRAMALDNKLNNQESVALDYLDIGITYRHWGKADSALYYLKRSAIHANEKNLSNENFVTSSKDGIIASSDLNIACVYISQGKYGEARQLLKQASPVFKQIKDEYNVLNALRSQAELESLTGAYDKAIALATDGLKQSRDLNTDEVSRDFLKVLADTYEAQHQYNKALEYFKQYKTATGSIFNAEKARIVAELQYSYETEKKDKQIILLNEEKERTNFIIIIISVTVVALVFLVVTIFLSKKLQRIRFREQEANLKALHEKSEREKIQIEASKSKEEEKNARLQLALESSERELATKASYIQQKNSLLEELQREITKLSEQSDQKQQPQINELKNSLAQARLLTEEDWEQFRIEFEKVHPGFFTKLRNHFYDLTPAETRLMALTHLNLGTKEIASMLAVSDQTVYKTRQRLRLKIGRSAEKGLSDLELNTR
jgi:tetratricopeptide (TPR) repeat protein